MRRKYPCLYRVAVVGGVVEGLVCVEFVNAAHVRVSTNSAQDAVTYRDIRNGVSVHLFRSVGAGWVVGDVAPYVAGPSREAPRHHRDVIVAALAATVAECWVPEVWWLGVG